MQFFRSQDRVRIVQIYKRLSFLSKLSVVTSLYTYEQQKSNWKHMYVPFWWGLYVLNAIAQQGLTQTTMVLKCIILQRLFSQVTSEAGKLKFNSVKILQ